MVNSVLIGFISCWKDLLVELLPIRIVWVYNVLFVWSFFPFFDLFLHRFNFLIPSSLLSPLLSGVFSLGFSPHLYL